ncbi:MAG: SWIM zinc finger family protein [Methanobrevibacter sp.]|jgi:hypothetical protein|nr:SWIM zinc finger family protein [Candidatus Methanovirga australis]
MKLSDLINSADIKIILRGKDYYANDYISSLIFNPEKCRYMAKVKGSYSEDYQIHVDVDKRGYVLDYDCDCPYDYGDICKHLIAVFLAIEDENFKIISDKNIKSIQNVKLIEEDKTSVNDETELLQLIETSSKEDLIEFLIDYSSLNTNLQRDLIRFLRKPNIDDEISILIGDIKEIISLATYETFHDDPYYYTDVTDKYCNQLEQIIYKCRKSLDENKYLLSFYVSIEIINGVNDLFDLDFEGLDHIFYESIEILSCACDLIEENCDNSQKEKVFNILIENSNNSSYSTDWNYDFVLLAIKFANENNKEAIFDTINKIGHSDYYCFQNLILKSQIIEKVEGKKAANDFKMEHLEVDKFLKEAIKIAIDNKDFKSAKELCLNKLKGSEINNYSNKWYEELHDVYESFNIMDKQVEISNALLRKGNVKYYYILKKLYKTTGVLEKEQNNLFKILIENSNFHSYAPILKKEKEWDILWKEVKNHPQEVFDYGNILSKVFKDEFYKLYQDELIKYGTKINNRKAYKDFANKISELYVIGGNKFADEVVNYFRENFKRKPAMQEELDFLNSKKNREK